MSWQVSCCHCSLALSVRWQKPPTLEDDEDKDDGFFDFDNVENEEAVAEPQPYFTYEAPEADVAPKTVHKPAPAQPTYMKQETTVYEPAFDLRQAVIYQTLLNNKYINAENQ